MTAVPRVVVTGVGAVTPLGHTVEDTARALERGMSAPATPTLFDASGFSESCGAEVAGFDAAPRFSIPKALKLAHRTTRFAVAAAGMALDDAVWPADRSREDLGIVLGTSGFDPRVEEIAHALVDDSDQRSVEDIGYFADRVMGGLNPLWLLVGLPNMISAHVAIQLDARGPNNTIMTDWIAGTQAVGEALRIIQGGEAVVVLAGGVDTGVFPHAYACYEQAGLFAGVEPGRGRFVPGEGAGVLLLEARDHAIGRGAPIRAEIRGYATAACDGNRRINPLVQTMRASLQDARVDTAEVAVIGNASVLADPYRELEVEAIQQLLGTDRRVAVVEHTSRLGHALAAAGAIDVALLVHGYADNSGGAIVSSSLGYSRQAATLTLTGPGAGAG